MTSPVGCEIDACGVMAVGRCRTCGRPFCASHQHRRPMMITGTGIHYDDPDPASCTQCPIQAEARRAEDQRAHDVEIEHLRREAPEELHGTHFFNADGHRALLRRAGAPRYRADLLKPDYVWKRKGLRKHIVEVPGYLPLGWVWPIGSLPVFNGGGMRTSQTVQVALCDTEPPTLHARPRLLIGALNPGRSAWEVPTLDPFRGDGSYHLSTDNEELEKLVRATAAAALGAEAPPST